MNHEDKQVNKEYSGVYQVGDLKTDWFPHRLWTNADLTLTIIWQAHRVTQTGTYKNGANYEITKSIYKKQVIELNKDDIKDNPILNYF